VVFLLSSRNATAESTEGYTDGKIRIKLSLIDVHTSVQGDELLTLKNTLFSFIAVFLISAFGLVAPAQAFQAATVSNEFAQVKQTADPNSATTTTLAKGTRVNTSDQPTNGFYKVRSATAMGWVAATDLSFGATKQVATGARPRHRRKQKYQWEAKIFTGLNFWSPSDINTVVGTTSMNTGTGFGAEIGYAVNPRLNIVLRIEHLSKTTTGTDISVVNNVSTTNNIELDYSATPVMVGADYTLLPGNLISLDGSALIGLASPTFNSIVNSAPDASFSGSSPALLIKVDLNWLVSDSFWLFGELGYRYLKTKQLVSSSYATNFLESGTGPSYTPIPIALDMSGPVFNIGARLNF
jgi:hypothetical protein